MGEIGIMTRRVEFQKGLIIEWKRERLCPKLDLDCELTSNLGGVLGIHSEDSKGKVTPGLRGRGEGESVLGRERIRS